MEEQASSVEDSGTRDARVGVTVIDLSAINRALGNLQSSSDQLKSLMTEISRNTPSTPPVPSVTWRDVDPTLEGDVKNAVTKWRQRMSNPGRVELARALASDFEPRSARLREEQKTQRAKGASMQMPSAVALSGWFLGHSRPARAQESIKTKLPLPYEIPRIQRPKQAESVAPAPAPASQTPGVALPLVKAETSSAVTSESKEAASQSVFWNHHKKEKAKLHKFVRQYEGISKSSLKARSETVGRMICCVHAALSSPDTSQAEFESIMGGTGTRDDRRQMRSTAGVFRTLYDTFIETSSLAHLDSKEWERRRRMRVEKLRIGMECFLASISNSPETQKSVVQGWTTLAEDLEGWKLTYGDGSAAMGAYAFAESIYGEVKALKPALKEAEKAFAGSMKGKQEADKEGKVEAGRKREKGKGESVQKRKKKSPGRSESKEGISEQQREPGR